MFECGTVPEFQRILSIIIERTFAQHQYNNHTIIKLDEAGLDIKITGHVVNAFWVDVAVDVQEQGKENKIPQIL